LLQWLEQFALPSKFEWSLAQARRTQEGMVRLGQGGAWTERVAEFPLTVTNERPQISYGGSGSCSRYREHVRRGEIEAWRWANKMGTIEPRYRSLSKRRISLRKRLKVEAAGKRQAARVPGLHRPPLDPVMTSRREDVIGALKALVAAALPNAEVKRNLAKPERIPPGGLVGIREGDRSDPRLILDQQDPHRPSRPCERNEASGL
jgi:hypothetical protein